MTNKNIKGRIVHKHGTEAAWKLAKNFVPMQGEIIIYDKDANYDYERFKIGDGVTKVNDLVFADDKLLARMTSKQDGVYMWKTMPNGYSDHPKAQTFKNKTEIKTTTNYGEDDVIVAYRGVNGINNTTNKNTITVNTDEGRECAKLSLIPTDGRATEARLQIICSRNVTELSTDELVFSTDIKCSNLLQAANRGVEFNGAGEVGSNGAVYGGKIRIQYDAENAKYFVTVPGYECYIPQDKWFNLRVVYAGLASGNPIYVYIDNVLMGIGAINGSWTPISAFDVFIGGTHYSYGTGLTGDIYFDNTYFGLRDFEFEATGIDKLAAAHYNPEEATGEHIAMRLSDGSILTKRELTDTDDDRIAASKHYVDGIVEEINNKLDNIEIPEAEANYFIFNLIENSYYGDCWSCSVNPEAKLPSILVIPGVHDGLTVGEIESYGFAHTNVNTMVHKIIIPEGVYAIGEWAFAADGYPWDSTPISSLQEIVLPSTLTSIAPQAFERCTGLIKINLEDTQITSTPENLFVGCTSLRELRLPNTVQTINSYLASTSYGSLNKIFIPSSVTTITGPIASNDGSVPNYYCEIVASDKPEGWNEHWNHEFDTDVAGTQNVVWNYASNIDQVNKKLDAIFSELITMTYDETTQTLSLSTNN